MNKYVKVTGEFGEKPIIEFLTDEVPDELIVETLSEGDGVYVEPSQVVAFDYLGKVFNESSAYYSSTFRIWGKWCSSG